MVFFRYAPFHFCVALIFGILIGFHLKPTQDAMLWSVIMSLIVIFLGDYLSSNSYGHQYVMVVGIYLYMFFTGMFLTGRQLAGERSLHYLSHHQEGDCLELEIKRVLKANDGWERYEAEVIIAGERAVTGRLYLALQKPGLSDAPDVGHVISTCNPPRDIIWSGNPGSFDFKSYAERRGMSQQIFCEEGSYVINRMKKATLTALFYGWKKRCIEQMDRLDLDSRNRLLLKALILGDRTNMPEKLATEFRDAGAAHILALSGLHVGIIIGMLRLMLQPFRRLFGGKWTLNIVELSVLWAFALFTGLSASVIRAVGMYSIYSTGRKRSHDLPPGASIVLALFLMLVFQPLFLFDLGFQLSFFAVGGILMLYPFLRNLWLPGHSVLRYFVQMVYVSTGAQLGVLPLILLYFQEFSGHFLISSLILIPLTAIVIPYGITVLIYSFVFSVPVRFSKGLDFIMDLMNNYVSWISGIRVFQWERIYFNGPLAMIMFCGLFIFFLLLRYPRKHLLLLLTGLILAFEIYWVWNRRSFLASEELFVANIARSSFVSFRSGDSLLNLGPLPKAGGLEEKVHQSYLNTIPMKLRIRHSDQKFMMSNNGELIRLVGRDHLVLEDGFQTRIVVLQNSPKVHLDKLICYYRPGMIIADGSNYVSFVKRWRKTCEKFKVPFHDTRDQGAFVYRSARKD